MRSEPISYRGVALGASIALSGVLIGAASVGTSAEGKLIGALILGILALALGIDPWRAAGLRRSASQDATDREEP